MEAASWRVVSIVRRFHRRRSQFSHSGALLTGVKQKMTHFFMKKHLQAAFAPRVDASRYVKRRFPGNTAYPALRCYLEEKLFLII